MNPLKIFKSLEPSKLSNLILLFTVALLFWTSITSLLPILPTYIQDNGGNPREIGLIMGSFAIGLLFSRVWLGKLADERSRKLVVLIGTLVGSIGPMGYVFFHTIYYLILVRAFHGISVAAFTTGYSALIVDLSPPKHKGELIGYMSLSAPIGMAIGPALGAFLKDAAGYNILFIVSASCAFFAFILTNQVQETNRNYHDYTNQDNLIISQKTVGEDIFVSRSFWELCVSPSLVVPAIVLLLIGCVFGTLVSFLPLYIRDLNIDFNLGLFYTAAAIASFVVRFFSGQASDRYGRGLFISVSILCYFFSMLLLSLDNSGNIFLFAGVLEGMGNGLVIPMMIALISDRCSSQERGKVFSFCISGFDVGMALGGPILGSVATLLGYRVIFGIGAGLSIIAFSIFLTFSNKNFSDSLRFAMGKVDDLYKI